MISHPQIDLIIFIYCFQYVTEMNLEYFNFQQISYFFVGLHRPVAKDRSWISQRLLEFSLRTFFIVFGMNLYRLENPHYHSSIYVAMAKIIEPIFDPHLDTLLMFESTI